MQEKDTHTQVVKGEKAWYALLFPFICFCIALGILYNVYEDLTLIKDDGYIDVIVGGSFPAFMFIVLGSVFGMVRDYHFDFEQKRYKIVKRVGIIGFGSWKPFKSLEYVSVFQNLDHKFEINLWYNANKHFFIDSYFFKKPAIEHAVALAKQLNIEYHNGLTNQQYTVEDDYVEPIPKDKRKIDAYFSQGNRPLWQTTIAALCFTLALVALYLFITGIDVERKTLKLPIRTIEIPIILFSCGIGFSTVNDYLFDLENNQFKIIHNIGPIKWGRWKLLSSLDYISVYQKRKGVFLINLWYNTNKHINLSGSTEYNKAMEVGGQLAAKLDIDLLDASDPHNTKWVEVE
ncbi:hypothetical protein [Marinirhabdus gelatinilytica]|uniref:Uncharacterized protein n=1 Tax=Marinirhabdus gelatinilytica TaxID=1703343 RepID=A0A370QKC3_9FLAO|nr:hypothetical protein [Marinirhabdus gelatinilytica]RDK88779.1 hypothetical protein C8D94_101656 [Marinirhabdus gelatinilytica]